MGFKFNFVFYSLAIVGLLVAISLLVGGVIHDLAFSNIVTKQEVYELEDVQGLDNNKFLYKFGNKAFEYERIDGIEVNKNYTVTFSKCLNCWLLDDDDWGIENIEIKEINKDKTVEIDLEIKNG